MEKLTQDGLEKLIRVGAVHRIFATPYPAIDGGGWYIDCDHNDHGQSRELHTSRYELRVFRTLDALVKCAASAGWRNQLVVNMPA